MMRLADALRPANMRAVVIVMRDIRLSDASETVSLALRFAANSRKGSLERFAEKTKNKAPGAK